MVFKPLVCFGGGQPPSLPPKKLGRFFCCFLCFLWGKAGFNGLFFLYVAVITTLVWNLCCENCSELDFFLQVALFFGSMLNAAECRPVPPNAKLSQEAIALHPSTCAAAIQAYPCETRLEMCQLTYIEIPSASELWQRGDVSCPGESTAAQSQRQGQLNSRHFGTWERFLHSLD